MRWRRWVAAGLLALWGAGPVVAARVFVVHSYGAGHVCGQPQHDGLVQALEDEGFVPGRNLEVGVFYMETKRRYTAPEAVARRGREALAALRAFRPDVVVTLDDNAFRTVGAALVGTELPVVFSGVNTPLDRLNRTMRFFATRSRPGANVTGVYEKLHFVDAVRAHCRLVPDTARVVFLGDRSPTGEAIRAQVLQELEDEVLPVPLELHVVETWEAYQELVRRLNRSAERLVLYPAALRLSGADGKTRTAAEILPWTARESRHPSIPINVGFLRAGLFGGVSVDFAAMGAQAGRMVARILRGTPAAEIPLEEAERVRLVFNLARARELGIRIPEDVLLAADEVIGWEEARKP
ncbi:ABC transporter substrate-binding protein [Deferrisoma camini]|uniref:ABC transporter substrate-binding protein n=1 Tax=Deferrisoma camini TaxID=1035120 RepID=UPI00046D00BA|nr:ABC transporter substrate binding protein [Deferrisoma camini]